MQIIFHQTEGVLAGGRLLLTWDIRLLATGRLVGRVGEMEPGGRCWLTTLGEHPSGNRHHHGRDDLGNIDQTQDAARRWARRRFWGVGYDRPEER